jgi:prepilin-type N-terminal cleavage/methylation domain-containing protein
MMRCRPSVRPSARGFTLIELILSLAIVSMIFTALAGVALLVVNSINPGGRVTIVMPGTATPTSVALSPSQTAYSELRGLMSQFNEDAAGASYIMGVNGMVDPGFFGFNSSFSAVFAQAAITNLDTPADLQAYLSANGVNITTGGITVFFVGSYNGNGNYFPIISVLRAYTQQVGLYQVFTVERTDSTGTQANSTISFAEPIATAQPAANLTTAVVDAQGKGFTSPVITISLPNPLSRYSFNAGQITASGLSSTAQSSQLSTLSSLSPFQYDFPVCK